MSFRTVALALIGTSALAFGVKFQAKVDLLSKSGSPLPVTIAELQPGGWIAPKQSADGGNVSPTVSWSVVPAKTKSFAIVVDDSDAKGFVHWLVYNLSPETVKVPAGQPASPNLNVLGSAMQGKNSAGKIGYYGPKPPRGIPHHYHFHVYALDVMTALKPGASKAELQRAMSGHVLAQGEAVAKFESRR